MSLPLVNANDSIQLHCCTWLSSSVSLTTVLLSFFPHDLLSFSFFTSRWITPPYLPLLSFSIQTLTMTPNCSTDRNGMGPLTGDFLPRLPYETLLWSKVCTPSGAPSCPGAPSSGLPCLFVSEASGSYLIGLATALSLFRTSWSVPNALHH